MNNIDSNKYFNCFIIKNYLPTSTKDLLMSGIKNLLGINMLLPLAIAPLSILISFIISIKWIFNNNSPLMSLEQPSL